MLGGLAIIKLKQRAQVHNVRRVMLILPVVESESPPNLKETLRWIIFWEGFESKEIIDFV